MNSTGMYVVASVISLAIGGCAMEDRGDSGDGATGTAEQALAYGTWGTFTAYGGRCLDLAGAVTNGGYAQIYDCNGGSNQLWTFANTHGPVFNGAAYSVGLQEKSNQLNVVVNPWTANVPSSLWTLPTGMFASAATGGGYCMAQDSFNNVTLNYCGFQNDVWQFDESASPLRIGGGCATTTSTASGSAIVIQPCTGGANQQWAFGANGSIRQAGRCLDVRGGTAALGVAIQLFDCHGGDNQRFTVKATLVNAESNRCLDLPQNLGQPDTRNQTGVVMAACWPNAQGQLWTFHW